MCNVVTNVSSNDIVFTPIIKNMHARLKDYNQVRGYCKQKKKTIFGYLSKKCWLMSGSAVDGIEKTLIHFLCPLILSARNYSTKKYWRLATWLYFNEDKTHLLWNLTPLCLWMNVSCVLLLQLEMEDEDTIDVFQQQTGGGCS